MTVQPKEHVRLLAIALLCSVALATATGLKAGRLDTTNVVYDGGEANPPPRTWIDTHAHPFNTPGSTGGDCLDYDCLTGMLEVLDGRHIDRAFLVPMPSTNENPIEDDLADAAATYPERYGYLMGGFSLNPKIHATADGQVSREMMASFAQRADVIGQGGALGYGEFAALHFSMGDDHPFEEVAPDHPLFLLLAEKASRYNIPIELHMEAAIADQYVARSLAGDYNNPTQIKGNIAGLERLLDHEPGAKIVWIHIGWDNTGDMTVTLLRSLLNRHPNLYLQIEISDNPASLYPDHEVVDEADTIRPEWLDLMTTFPDRFTLGSDAFYMRSDTFPDHIAPLDRFVQQLPEDLASQIGYENAQTIYSLIR